MPVPVFAGSYARGRAGEFTLSAFLFRYPLCPLCFLREGTGELRKFSPFCASFRFEWVFAAFLLLGLRGNDGALACFAHLNVFSFLPASFFAFAASCAHGYAGNEGRAEFATYRRQTSFMASRYSSERQGITYAIFCICFLFPVVSIVRLPAEVFGALDCPLLLPRYFLLFLASRDYPLSVRSDLAPSRPSFPVCQRTLRRVGAPGNEGFFLPLRNFRFFGISYSFSFAFAAFLGARTWRDLKEVPFFRFFTFFITQRSALGSLHLLGVLGLLTPRK